MSINQKHTNMKRSTSWVLSLGFIFLIAIHSINVNAQGFSSQTTSELQQVLETFQGDPSFVGGISAAIKVDELATWQGASGYAARNINAQNELLPGGTPFTTTTLSRMYSVTKTFTAALVLELAEAGILNLDNPVNGYFPLHAVNPGLNGAVTIRQLLAHESGYSDYTGEMQFVIAVAFQPTHIWTPYEVLSFVHQENPPGSVRKYSSTNYILLGALIEIVTGQPVEQHFRSAFITPLGLSSLYFGVRESMPAGSILAAPHDNLSAFNPIFQLTGQPTFPYAYTNISAFPLEGVVSAAFTGGALVSNASDLAAWGNALFTGRATSASILDAMINSISSTPDAQGDFLGYGIWKSSKMSTSETFLGHDGSAPGYRSVMFYQPEKRLTLVVMCNFHGADIYAIARALYAVVPDYICGKPGSKEEKIRLCFNGQSICVVRRAADGFIRKGAYLGPCETGQAQDRINNKMGERTSNGKTFLVYPSPARNSVSFRFATEADGPVTIEIYDMTGKVVAGVFNGLLERGASRQIVVNCQNLDPAAYIAVMKTKSGVQQQKIIITR
jgi:D-alanyl-D-alanine carboxypeptidase